MFTDYDLFFVFELTSTAVFICGRGKQVIQPCDSNQQGVVVFAYTLKIKQLYRQILQRAGAILAERGKGTPYNLLCAVGLDVVGYFQVNSELQTTNHLILKKYVLKIQTLLFS